MNSDTNTLSIDMSFLDQNTEFSKTKSVPCRSFVRYLAKLSLHINHLDRDCEHLEERPEHISKILYNILITGLKPYTYIRILKSIFSIPKNCLTYLASQLMKYLPIEVPPISNQTSNTDAEKIANLQKELDLLKEQIMKISNNTQNANAGFSFSNNEKSIAQPTISPPMMDFSSSTDIHQTSLIPPPPPPPLPIIEFSSKNKSSKVLTSSPRVSKVQSNDCKVKESNDNKALSMFDVLKDITKVKLRPVERSPGGRPIKMCRKSLSVSDDINDHFNHSLRKQFRSVRSPKTSPIKDFSPIQTKGGRKELTMDVNYHSQENLSINHNMKPSDIGGFIEYALKKKFDSSSDIDKPGIENSMDVNKSISFHNSSMNDWMN